MHAVAQQRPHYSQMLLAIAVGSIVAVACLLWDMMPYDTLLFLCGIGGIVSIVLFYRHWWMWLSVLFLLGMALGGVRTHHVLLLEQHVVPESTFRGTLYVVSVPRQGNRYIKMIARDDRGSKMLLRLPRHAPVVFGSEVTGECRRKRPEAFETFDYPRYLLMHGVTQICTMREYAITGRTQTPLSYLADMRRYFENNLSHLMPSPESALGNGLIFGGDDRLSQTLQDAFARTGMSHIVAVSGYNVTIIVLAVTGVGIFFGLWRKQAAVLSIVAIVLFVAMIGFPSSGVRAAVMGSLVLFAVMYGRASHVGNAVLFAAATMLLWSPLQLRYDIGFQLSFLAVIGIVLFYPFFQAVVTRGQKPFGFLEILLLTISAQLFVVPVIMFHFHTLSLTSLMSNILVLPVLPFTMLFVFLAALCSAFFWPLASFFAWIAYGLLHYEIFIISFFAERSWSSLAVPTFSFPLALLYYMVLLSIAYFFYNYDQRTLS